jgi:DNA repair protein RadA/Sms
LLLAKRTTSASTNISEFDRVLGGGIVAGAIILISGDPGVGKSTLLTQLAISTEGKRGTVDTKTVAPCLYVAGEESARQIKLRADRLQKNSNLSILPETDVDTIIATIKDLKPSMAIIDSIQTLQTTDLQAVPGSISQVRECAHRLQALAKSTHIPIFLVGHITKDGTVAGPKTLEHLVDVVLSLEGDPLSNYRILRTTKNRFGATDEVGIFAMEEGGMIEVTNPSSVFLEQKVNAPGSVVIPTLNGLRPILIEVQSLVTKTFLPVPRRTGTGVDNNRLQLLTAVLAKRLHLNLSDQDIFVNATGGFKITEPAADLGIAAAIISSYKEQPIDPKTACIGEIGLLGEIRPIRDLEKRAKEARKLGYTNIISPDNTKNLSQLVDKLFGKKHL